jgi:SAM-dependent methyltransferase
VITPTLFRTFSPVATLRRQAGAVAERRLTLLAPSRRLRFARALEVLARLPADAAVDVLDAGCGDGFFSHEIARRRPRWNVVGVDANGELLLRAAVRARALGLGNIRFEQGDIVEVLPEAGFDAVAAIECLAEVTDDVRALAALARASRPGGLLVGQVPAVDWQPVLATSESTWRDEVRHGYACDELVRMLATAGFTDVILRPSDHALARLAQELADRVKQRPISIRALAYPAFVAATRAEMSGLAVGAPRSIFFTAVRDG